MLFYNTNALICEKFDFNLILFYNLVIVSEKMRLYMVRIILDAMGGDNAPQAVIEGAELAINKFEDISITLVGREEVIKSFLKPNPRIHIVHAPDVIEMAESPVKAVQRKKESSLVVGLNMLKNGEGDAFITAGSTGATVAGGTLIVRRLDGILRPALAPVLPTSTHGKLLLIDCGANVDCKSAYLRQFGIMGSIYMNKIYGIPSPRVGLINNGAEEEKGNSLTKEAYQLLKNTDCINFAGNAEGRDILSGDYDVAVCDGFVGNVFMKAIEGFAGLLLGLIKENITSSAVSSLGGFLAKKAFKEVKKEMDYTEYGGAPLLGIKSCVIKAHGSSDSKSIMNAIGQARSFVINKITQTIAEEIAKAPLTEE